MHISPLSLASLFTLLVGCAVPRTNPNANQNPRAAATPPGLAPGPADPRACPAGTTKIEKPLATWCERAPQQPDGHYQYRYPNGRPLAEGRIIAGQRDGGFRVWSPDGALWIQGAYVEGVRDGEWIRTDREDHSVTRTTWTRGRQQGHVRITLADGSVHSDQPVNEQPLDPDPAIVLRAPEHVEYDQPQATLVRSRGRRLNGKSVGLEQDWHENGSRDCDLWFNWSGLKADVAFCWDDTGVPTSIYEYDLEGNLIDEVRPR